MSVPSSLPFIPDEHEYEMHRAYILAQVSSAVACLATFNSLESIDKNYNRGRKLGAETVPRVRRNMNEYLQQMDDHGFCRRYRMEKVAFWTLLDIIESRLPSTGIKRKRGGVPNGPISKAARLSMALRVFAGGNPLDIAEVHGVGDDESMISVWMWWTQFTNRLSLKLSHFNQNSSQVSQWYLELFDKLFLLVGGIYPDYTRFGKGIKDPIRERDKEYTGRQEASRKDIERVFGVLQARFSWTARPIYLMKLEDITRRMKTCLILHNMGVQDRIMDNDVYATYNPAFNQEIASEKEKRMYSMTYVPTVSTTRAYKLN